MSSVPDRKFNSILKRIPVETIFDVLKFLTFKQWFSLQFSNWRLAEIIKKNENYLAFPKLFSIEIYRYKRLLTPSRNITYDGFTARIEDLDENEKSDMTEALVRLNQVPLALIHSDENPDFLFVYIEMTENFFEDSLLIKLPIHPSTIEELALIRFWLLKLSQAHFEDIYANRCILNPKFLSVLNPSAGPRKILFHANDVVVGHHETAILANLAQFICTRRIYLQTSIHFDETHRDNLFKFIMGTGNTLEKFRIYIGSNQAEFCEFLVKSLMHMETGLENVPETIECDGYVGGESDSWPNISGAKFTGFDLTDEEDPYGNKKYSYTFNNSWKKKVTFCLELIGQEFEYLQLFKIVKITTKK